VDATEIYVRISTRENGSLVEATRVDRSAVLDRVVETVATEYEDLGPSTRRALDWIIANTSDRGYGEYRLPADGPVVDLAPALIERDGQF